MTRARRRHTLPETKGPYRNFWMSVHEDDVKLADDLAALMSEATDIQWKRSAVYKTALMRGLTSLAEEYGIYP